MVRDYLFFGVCIMVAGFTCFAAANPPLDRAIAREKMEEIERLRQIEHHHEIDAGPVNHKQMERLISVLERIAVAVERGEK